MGGLIAAPHTPLQPAIRQDIIGIYSFACRKTLNSDFLLFSTPLRRARKRNRYEVSFGAGR